MRQVLPRNLDSLLARTTVLFAMLASIVISATATPAFATDLVSKSPEGATVYFITPKDGQTLAPSFEIKFGLKGMGVAPAGVSKDSTGHHHILIDVNELPDLSQPLPVSENIRHFGGGQTETVLSLPPGKHSLQLVLGNYAHVPHDKPLLSEKITVIVE